MVPERPPLEIASAVNKVFMIVLAPGASPAEGPDATAERFGA
jgi:hypothetical protein